MPWTSGKSGNPGGRPRVKIMRDALSLELKGRENQSPGYIRRLAGMAIDRAMEGDMTAWREIVDRLDGKVPQPLAGSDEDAPITVRQIITGVPRPGDEAPEE